MSPPVALGDPKKTSPFVDPCRLVGKLDPGLVTIGHHRAKLAGLRVGQYNLILVLQPVELLQDEFLRILGPLHSRNVVVAQVVRGLDPSGRTAVDAHHADPAGRIRLADLGMLELRQRRIERIGRVDHDELTDALGIELPIGHVPPVGAEAETVPHVELFLIDPIGRTVDDPLGSVGRKGRDLQRVQVLDVEIVLVDVAHPLAVGRELGKHQRSFFGITAQLTQGSGP